LDRELGDWVLQALNRIAMFLNNLADYRVDRRIRLLRVSASHLENPSAA
jgi:hypothetical protein